MDREENLSFLHFAQRRGACTTSCHLKPEQMATWRCHCTEKEEHQGPTKQHKDSIVIHTIQRRNEQQKTTNNQTKEDPDTNDKDFIQIALVGKLCCGNDSARISCHSFFIQSSFIVKALPETAWRPLAKGAKSPSPHPRTSLQDAEQVKELIKAHQAPRHWPPPWTKGPK